MKEYKQNKNELQFTIQRQPLLTVPRYILSWFSVRVLLL